MASDVFSSHALGCTYTSQLSLSGLLGCVLVRTTAQQLAKFWPTLRPASSNSRKQLVKRGRPTCTDLQIAFMPGPVHIPWRADFAVGWGISGFSGLPAPKPWAFEDSARSQLDQLQERSDAVPGNISFQQGVISSTEDYERAIKAAVSMDVKAWGPVSGQASSEFLSSLDISSKSMHYVVVSRFETATTNIFTQQSIMPALSQFAADLLAKVGPERWAEQFGTHFIAGYVLGGLLIGKASFTSTSSAAASKMKGKLEAKFGFFGSGLASGSAQRSLDTVRDAHVILYELQSRQFAADRLQSMLYVAVKL